MRPKRQTVIIAKIADIINKIITTIEKYPYVVYLSCSH